MQIASNEVARNAIKDILKTENNSLLPTLEQIAEKDATGVGDALFKDAIPTDSAFLNNAAWSGTVLFTGLGSDQSWRLLGSGSSGELDAVSDLKDILFAFSAFVKAVTDTVSNFGLEGLNTVFNTYGLYNSSITAIEIALGAFYNTVALPYVTLVFNLTPEKYLDILRQIADPSVDQNTDSTNFVARANALFYGQ